MAWYALWWVVRHEAAVQILAGELDQVAQGFQRRLVMRAPWWKVKVWVAAALRVQRGRRLR